MRLHYKACFSRFPAFCALPCILALFGLPCLVSRFLACYPGKLFSVANVQIKLVKLFLGLCYAFPLLYALLYSD